MHLARMHARISMLETSMHKAITLVYTNASLTCKMMYEFILYSVAIPVLLPGHEHNHSASD